MPCTACRRSGPDDVEDREGGQVDDAGAVAHREVLGVDDRRPPAGVPLVLARQHPRRRTRRAGASLEAYQNGRSQPTVSKNTAPAAFSRGVHRREALAALARPLLAGVHDAVGLVERLRRARPDVRAGALVRVEAGDVGVADVDLGVPVGHPLRDRAPDARALLDPHRRGRPQALDLGRLAEDRRAVGGEREQPVDRVADLGALGAERVGHQLERLLQLRVEVVGGERQSRSGRACDCSIDGMSSGSCRIARWA